ncbi:hypothetical protein PIB30_050220 [Stylosanthes scabra]|uniref:Uncharacterized protein n=1 Tax=Stylosanthes scabra TaxID=79078 RepID=A0ABU6WHK8_9FABA|nr:hypothetical protein [Stylosanthes scabra]
MVGVSFKPLNAFASTSVFIRSCVSSPGKGWPFWLDDEGEPFPWVYWNPEVKDCHINVLNPLETLAFEFLQSLSAGLGKKSNFKCHWIIDHSDAEVGAFLDSLLGDMGKQTRFDRLRLKMAGTGPRSILSTPIVPTALDSSG